MYSPRIPERFELLHDDIHAELTFILAAVGPISGAQGAAYLIVDNVIL